MPGTVVTFYSYKGGVGRSFALANVATILTEWGCRVLVVDWDIEAPGLIHYFQPYIAKSSRGVLEFLLECAKGGPAEWSSYATEVRLPERPGELMLMPASADNTDYASVVQSLDWDEMYEKNNLGQHLESLREVWVKEFDIILIDSRTGITDFSGITIAQLPDVLAFMFTANGQSLYGSADIAKRAMDARSRLSLDRPALLPLPIPARFEQREEYDRAQEWRQRFSQGLSPFFNIWAPQGSDPAKLVDLLTIPYVPRWTFGEELASMVETVGSTGTRAPSHAVSYACETLAALLVQKFSKADLLISSRDEYVHTARSIAAAQKHSGRQRMTVYISYAIGDPQARAVAQSIAHLVVEIGCRPVFNDIVLSADQWSEQLRQEIEGSGSAIVIFSAASSKRQSLETETFLRQSLRTDDERPVFPVVLKGGERRFISSRISSTQGIFLQTSDPSDADLKAYLAPVLDRLKSSSASSMKLIGGDGAEARLQDESAESTKLAVAYGQQAATLQASGRLDDALGLLKKQEDLWTVLANKDGLASNLGSQAQVLQSSGKLQEAIGAYQRQQYVLEEQGNERALAVCYSNQASLLSALQRIPEAEPLIRKSLAITEKTLGPDHPSTAHLTSALGLLLQNMDRPKEAELLFRRAILINEKIYGSDHSAVSASLKQLANLLQKLGKFAEAEPLLRRALATDEELFGINHLDVAEDLSSLGNLLLKSKRPNEAESLIRGALSINENLLHEEHPTVARDLRDLAEVMLASGRFKEAEPLLRRALSIDEKAYGPDHIAVGQDLISLCQCVVSQNRIAEGEVFWRRALSIYDKVFGPNDPTAVKLKAEISELFEEAQSRQAKQKAKSRETRRKTK